MNQRPYQDSWWWLEDDDEDLATKCFDEADRVSENTLDRQQQILESSALYGDLAAWPGMAGVERILPMSRRISHNVIATATDALVSEVTQTKPRPMAVTIGGDFTHQVRARKLTEYWDAKFTQLEVYDIGRQAVRDSIISGLGIIRAYRKRPGSKDDSVGVERIWPGSFIIDDRGAIDVHPRSCFIRRAIDRSYLEKLYPEKADAIERARRPQQRYGFMLSINREDLVEVLEGWHLPSAPGAGDGKHVISISTTALHQEEYENDTFPLAFCRAVAPQRGFWGESIVRRAATAQFELNKLLRRVQESMHLHAVPRVFVNRGSGIVKPHFTNDLGILIEYDGAPPMFMTPQSMGSDVYAHIDRLENWIYKEMGISQLSASSLKPAGLNSGRALRVYNDTQSRRFINLERSYEKMHCDLARQMINFERQISEDYPEHQVVYQSGALKKVIPFKKIDLEKDIMMVQVYPTSALPTTPAAKLQALEEMVTSGMIDNETFLRMADVPDLEAVRDTVVAPQELLEKRFDSMLETGEYSMPEPYMDLTKGINLCSLYVQKAEVQGAPDDRLELLRQWIGDARVMLEQAQLRSKQEALRKSYMMAEEVKQGMVGPGPGPAGQPPPTPMPEPQAPDLNAVAALPGSAEPMPGPDMPPAFEEMV